MPQGKSISPIPVHAFGDGRTHLALPHRGRLRLGRLGTLCGLQAVTELALFAMAAKSERCRICFAQIDGDGVLRPEAAALARPGRGRPGRPKESADRTIAPPPETPAARGRAGVRPGGKPTGRRRPGKSGGRR